jgi:hypothetical protein
MTMLDRRRFLALLLLTLETGVGLATPEQQGGPGTRRKTDSLDELAAMIGSTAHRAGRLYLEQTPDERDPAVLVDTLWAELASGEPIQSATALRSKLAERLDADFAEGRTVEIEGWILARTEVRMYALAAVIAHAPDALSTTA